MIMSLFNFPSSDSTYVNQDFLEKIKKTVSDEAFRQEYLAEPLASTGNPFGIDHIKNNTNSTLSTEPTVVYAADLAKHNDWT